jgi:DNA-directed RNA polymerase subunit RPC12/RpoP
MPTPVRVEYVCDRCLHAVYADDDAPRPVCPRCGIKLTPDADTSTSSTRRQKAAPFRNRVSAPRPDMPRASPGSALQGVQAVGRGKGGP